MERGIQRTVLQHVGHFLDRAAMLDQATGQGVTQSMSPAVRDAGALECISHHAANGIYAHRLIVWCHAPYDQ